MSNDEKNKKIEALEKMFAPKDEFKLSADKKNIKKIPDISPEPRDIELQNDVILPDLEPKKVVEEVKHEKEVEPEVKPESKSPLSGSKNFPLEKIRENLKPEVKEMLKKIESTIPKESVDKLINVMENNKNIIFDSGITKVFDGLSSGEASLLSKKLAEWDIPKEASEVNASVIVAWLNKTKK